MGELQVTNVGLDALSPYPSNARSHSAKQIRQIARSIKEFGFTNPVLIDESQEIIAGHGRLQAAKLLDLKKIPTICLAGLSSAQKRMLRLADNKIAENAGWNMDLLTIELDALLSLDTDLDIEFTGFEMGEIDVLLADGDGTEEDPADLLERDDFEGSSVSSLGDIWQAGPHKIICGNAITADTYDRLLGDERAAMVITDPPYNVPIDGHVCGTGRVKHDDFVMATGEMTNAQFTAFLEQAFGLMAQYSKDGSIHFSFMDWRHIEELMAAAGRAYDRLLNLCVWNKTNGSMGSLYRSKHELVFVFKRGTAAHINNVNLGRHGRYRTNVWDYAGVNTFRKGRMEDLTLHPTV